MTTTEVPVQQKANPVKSFITGGFGGICNVLSGHPLDTIKVRLQTMPRPQPGQQPLYTGTFDCARKTIAAEGVRGLYKGMSAPLTGVAPIFAMCFAGYALGKRLQQRGEDAKLTYPQIFVAGSFSGLFSTLVMAPGERIKVLLQTQDTTAGKKKYNGMVDTAVKLYKEGGIRSVFKGTGATMLRDLPANGMYFLVYEYLQDLARKNSDSGQINTASTIFAGGVAGISYWLMGMPADVLKSRLQADLPANGLYFLCYDALTAEYRRRWHRPNVDLVPAIVAGGVAGIAYWIGGMPADVLKSRLQSAPDGTYPKGARSVFVQLMREDGPAALYRGFTPVILRAFPANAAAFFGIELANLLLRRVAPDF